MATFEAKVYRVRIEPHPNADKLELAIIGDYRSIVAKGSMKTGDLGVYIQEGSIVPDWLIAKMGLVGKLAGKAKNRVKAIKLRGVLSQGLVYPALVKDGTAFIDTEPKPGTYFGVQNITPVQALLVVQEGKDVATELGITKWEPPIPVHMAGEVNTAFGKTIDYDIENWKKYPDVLIEGEDIVLTEKLHGTWCCLGFHPDYGDIVTSKGLSKQGLVFKDNDANQKNLYVRAHREVIKNNDTFTLVDHAFYILGEVFGKGVQDLHYGQDKPVFRAFDVYIGSPGQGRYLNDDEKDKFLESHNIQRVPVLYRGPYSRAIVDQFTNGKDTISGTNVREGVIITPSVERRSHDLGRVILKSVSEAYLLRGSDDEVTEYA